MSSLKMIRWLWVLVGLTVLGHSSDVLAQNTLTLPPAQLLPPHSKVEVFTLPAPSVSVPSPETPVSVKPFLTPDSQELQQLKEFLQGPNVLPTAPGVIQDTAPQVAAPLPLAPAVSRSFEGLANSDNAAIRGFLVLPPDDNLGVGPNHIFQIVNLVGRITDKFGGLSIPTFSLGVFFGVDTGFNESDPRVIYDAISSRWFATYFEFSSSVSSIILAVSATNDPTGTFCRYRIGNPTSETFVQDFPMLGVSDDKVVVSYNGFSFTSPNPFIGAGYYVLNKADLLACTTVRMVRVAPSLSKVTPHPTQSLGSTSNLYMAMHAATSTLTLLTIGGVPGVSTVTETSTALGIRSWVSPPNAPQAGSSVLLDTNDDRPLSVAWQSNSLWVAGNEACTPTGDSVARSCFRVIEVKTDTLTVLQDMTFGAVGDYYYYPAFRPDSAGDGFVVFTRSSSSAFASVRVTGRLATDPLNTLQASSEIRTGGGAQTHSSGRMGDYSGAAVDPSDSSAVWVMGEYIQTTGTAPWGTFVAQLKFSGGGGGGGIGGGGGGGGQPDLVVTALSAPSTATAGSTISVPDTVMNSGTASAGSFVVGFYLSTDTTITTGDTFLGSRTISGLAAGASSTATTMLTIPAGTTPGTYFVGAIADNGNVIVESNETNNTLASGPMTVSSGGGGGGGIGGGP